MNFFTFIAEVKIKTLIILLKGQKIVINFIKSFSFANLKISQKQYLMIVNFLYRGSVSNMLVTSCKDNICRIWVETILPDDGLVNMYQFDPMAAQNPKFRTHRHKHRFMQRLKHMK